MSKSMKDTVSEADDPRCEREKMELPPRGGGCRDCKLPTRRVTALASSLLALLKDTPCTLEVVKRPAAFSWIDGFDGRKRMHRPLAFVRRADGHHAFLDALPRHSLLNDPEMDGVRVRIELECLARGFHYEVWTEEEVRKDRTHPHLVRVADASERIAYRQAPKDGLAASSALLAIAQRLHLRDIRWIPSGCVGMSGLTGIFMIVGGKVDLNPLTHIVVWHPLETPKRKDDPPLTGQARASEPACVREVRPVGQTLGFKGQ